MIQARLSRRLFEQLQRDLRREHPYALERVGFLFGRVAPVGDGLIVFPIEYVPVEDDHYSRSGSAAAVINSDAIRAALQRSLDTGWSAFHVHLHDWVGVPWFSRVDLVNLDRLVPSFHALVPRGAHGAIVLSEDSGSALIWPQAGAKPEPAGVSIVGYPLTCTRAYHGR